MRSRRRRVPAATLVAAAILLIGAPPLLLAQSADEDREPQRGQPDFTAVNLPTTLRLPPMAFAFRVTHRFTRPLGQGSFADSLGDLFGLDSAAQIGLELRFGLAPGLQAGIYRTNDKTIDLFAGYNLLKPSDGQLLSASVLASVEGTDNFQEEYSPSLAAPIGVNLGDRLALYAVPTWVGNARLGAAGEDDFTVLLGLAARFRLRRGLYVVGETSPRLAGYKGRQLDGSENNALVAFGFEGQVGGHVFQLNVSNGFSTMPAGLARGTSSDGSDWYLGFNISRKFY